MIIKLWSVNLKCLKVTCETAVKRAANNAITAGKTSIRRPGLITSNHPKKTSKKKGLIYG